jgi:hypothetical protein
MLLVEEAFSMFVERYLAGESVDTDSLFHGLNRAEIAALCRLIDQFLESAPRRRRNRSAADLATTERLAAEIAQRLAEPISERRDRPVAEPRRAAKERPNR